MFDWITGIVRTLGYPGVAVLTFLENVFPPIPSELVIPLAGYVSATGEMGLWGVVAAGSVGSLAGAILWYEVGRRLGERRVRDWVDRFGRWLTLTASDVDRAQQWFQRHGALAVFVGRLIPGVRTFVSLPAGFARMPMPRFLIYSAAGTAIWTAALAYAGVMLKANFAIVGDYVGTATNILLVLVAATMVKRYVQCFRPGRPCRPGSRDSDPTADLAEGWGLKTPAHNIKSPAPPQTAPAFRGPTRQSGSIPAPRPATG